MCVRVWHSIGVAEAYTQQGATITQDYGQDEDDDDGYRWPAWGRIGKKHILATKKPSSLPGSLHFTAHTHTHTQDILDVLAHTHALWQHATHTDAHSS